MKINREGRKINGKRSSIPPIADRTYRILATQKIGYNAMFNWGYYRLLEAVKSIYKNS